MSGKKLSEILTRELICVPPATPASEVMDIMRNMKISCVLILEDNKPIGIFTERNIVQFAAHQGTDVFDSPIRDLMSSPVLTATQHIDIQSAYNLLSSHHIRHLAVEDQNGRTIGVVTQSDIMAHLGYEFFVETKKIYQVMTKVVFTMTESTPLPEALTEMADKSLSCLVVAEGNRPTGILTERDVARILVDYHDISGLTVGEVMSRSVQTVSWDTPLHETVEIMRDKKLRRLVVVDGAGEISGITTQSDIVKGLEARYIETLNKIIREQSVTIEQTSKDLVTKTVYLDSMLQSSVDTCIIATDLRFRVVYFNPAAESITGQKKNNVLGRDVREVISRGNLKSLEFEKAVASIRVNGNQSFVLAYDDAAGKKRFVRIRICGIRDNIEALIGYFIMGSDITKRVIAEEELRRAYDGMEKRVKERTAQLAEAMTGTIQAMAYMVEMRDPYTSGHQRRVANLAREIATYLDFPEKFVEGVYMAGLIHDIGKIRVPLDILSNPGKLNYAEFELLKPHPQIGFDILKGIEFPWPIAQMVIQHHEMLDGSGYPFGLTASDIMIEAKILTVADVVEAMSSHRPYRPALGLDKALEEITLQNGRLYDPVAVDACITLLTKKGYKME